MKIQNINNIDFRALPVSKIHITTSAKKASYTIYKASNKDEQFLNDLYFSVDLKKIMPNLLEMHYLIWNKVVDYGLRARLNEKTSVYLIANNDKTPCGFLNFTDMDKKYNVNYAATWPILPKIKEFMAGKALFTELFNMAMKNNKERIELEALRYAPFDPVSKYMELGFKMCGGSDYQETMRIGKIQIEKTLEKFKNIITRNEIKHSKEVNLYDELKVVKDFPLI